jgi:hypothetical protein
MPPLAHLEDYLELLAAVEATAAEQGVKVVLEGYPPPRDPRLKLLQVTPDPGVIEVNIHPAHDWAELVDHTEFLYEAAHLSRCRPRSSCSTAATPAPAAATTSCWAGPRRPTAPSCAGPTCWPACSTYWHNHPSLSYLFSGPVHRPDQPGAAHRRGAQRPGLRGRDRPAGAGAPAVAARARRRAPLAGRPLAAQPADRRHRQHPPQRVLHRQAVFARRADRPPGPAGAACLRDAAARTHEPGAAAAAARAGGLVLARTLPRRWR